MSKKVDPDILSVIWALSKLGRSDRFIARLGRKLPRSHHTITRWREMAYELLEEGKLPISAKDGRRLRISSMGNSSDIEYLDGKANHGNCGGGKRVKSHIEGDDDWRYELYNKP
jgi:hypothetical protein